ncbi:hypothetical protein FJO69_02630 [[Mycoplasma] falconis]|uniref:Type I restriction modification DNA specificity domain-containing protein n=1 Tax=[Mycoplasma] falconis TaxID=92403 RepID=A0A501X8X9_9BACT|nr:hypothetical protein [[Mycoplasma] falconis]TPE56916.1 hypothetical protein FJO69_02630 [[Mycoplasma] falconis]
MIEKYEKILTKIEKILKVELQKYKQWQPIKKYNPTVVNKNTNKFENEKIYLDTGSLSDINNYSNDLAIFNCNNKPSRASLLPETKSVYFAKLKNTNKYLLINNNKDILNNYILSSGFLGIKESDDFPLSLIFSILISRDFIINKDNNCQGTTMAALTLENFYKINVKYLTKQERKNFDNKYKCFVFLFETISLKIKKLNNIKTNLLNKYF